MRISLSREGDRRFSLSFNSGHFSGTLGSISTESVEELKDSLEKLLNSNDEDNYELIWNPRSRRLEKQLTKE